MTDYQYIEGSQYSDDVLNAVRYGYQYRLEAERYCQDESIHCHNCLLDAPDILNWFANLIINGVAWDVLKRIAVDIKELFQREKRTIPPMAHQILTNQRDFRRFYEYVKEFKDGKMTISSRENNYIFEEIVADYCGKEAEKIYEAEKRLPTVEEHKRILHDAYEAAKVILTIKDNPDKSEVPKD